MRELAAGRIQNGRAQSVRRGGGQLLEEIRERLFHARGILDFDARNFQSQNGEAHRHAMVVVGLNLRAVQLGREDFQRVAGLDDLRAALGQLGAQGDDAFAFLDAQAAEVGEESPCEGQGRKRDCCHYTVAELVFAGNCDRLHGGLNFVSDLTLLEPLVTVALDFAFEY